MKSEPTRPFSEQGNYISMHRVLFDEVMPHLSGSAWKVLCFIVRKTIGWQKDFDILAYSQIKEGTGIKGDETIRNALQELQGFEPVKEGRRTVGWLRDLCKPDLIMAYPGVRRYDGTLEPTGYALNPEVEIQPTSIFEVGDSAHFDFRRDNNQSSISNSKRSNLTVKRGSNTNSSYDSLADFYDFEEEYF